jgi:hypothetical protein
MLPDRPFGSEALVLQTCGWRIPRLGNYDRVGAKRHFDESANLCQWIWRLKLKLKFFELMTMDITDGTVLKIAGCTWLWGNIQIWFQRQSGALTWYSNRWTLCLPQPRRYKVCIVPTCLLVRPGFACEIRYMYRTAAWIVICFFAYSTLHHQSHLGLKIWLFAMKPADSVTQIYKYVRHRTACVGFGRARGSARTLIITIHKHHL